jgi:2-C-methyl-D-erythritol 4-phosphate cytidylyltransferase
MGLRGGKRKPLFELGGRSVLAHALAALAGCGVVESIVVVGRSDELDDLRARAGGCPKPVRVVAGGDERTDSARLGVQATPADGPPLVAIHDAARPLVTSAAVERVIRAAAEHGAALLALPCADTVKETDDGERCHATADRARLWLAQTPQVFERASFLELCARAAAEGFTPTDDASLHERYVGPVRLVPGERTNLKLTSPEDLVLAEAILHARAAAELAR